MARIIICDRCGKQIDRGEVIGHINFWNEDNGESYAEVTSFHDWDFCPDCMGDIYAFIKSAATLDHARMTELPAGGEDLKSLKDWREIADVPEIEPEEEAEEEPEEEPEIEPEKAPETEPEEVPEPAEMPEEKPKKTRKKKKYMREKVDVDTRGMTAAERAETLAKRREQEEKKAEAAGPDAGKYGYKSNKADWPKFKACLAAGKDVKWLAVEFGVTEWTIRNWKRKLKEMEEAGEAEQIK